MKRIIAAAVAAIMLALAPGAATAATPDARKLGTGYFTVGAANLPASGCISHPMRADVNIGYETDGWFLSVTANRPDGSIADGWVSEVYWDDWGQSYFEETILLCTGIDTPGSYTLNGVINTVNNGSATVVKQPMSPAVFAVNAYVAPTPPPPPPPAPPVAADVTGSVTKKRVDRGVQFTFKSKALPAGTVVGNKLQWSIVSDDKVKSFSQGPSAVSKKTLKFPKRSGIHKIKVLRNGKVAMRVIVRA